MATSSQPQLLISQIHYATDSLLALNNDHSIELSAFSLAELDQIIRTSFFTATINDSDALLITFDQSSRYEHVNFLWFRGFFERTPRKMTATKTTPISFTSIA
jgi:predicted GNAT superfamily acetyltransferase